MRLPRLSRLLYRLASLAWVCVSAVTWRTGRASTASDPRENATASTMDSTQVVPTTSPGVYCPLVVNGVSWTLFRGRCYHVSKFI